MSLSRYLKTPLLLKYDRSKISFWNWKERKTNYKTREEEKQNNDSTRLEAFFVTSIYSSLCNLVFSVTWLVNLFDSRGGCPSVLAGYCRAEPAVHQYWPDQHTIENSELYILLSVKFLSLVGEDKDARTQSAEMWKVFKRERKLDRTKVLYDPERSLIVTKFQILSYHYVIKNLKMNTDKSRQRYRCRCFQPCFRNTDHR